MIILIQFCLIILAIAIGWCELSKLFKDSIWSNSARGIIGVSLLILGYYAHFLIYVPYIVVFCLFVVVVSLTFICLKLLINEHDRRILLNHKESNIKILKGVRNE